MLGTNDAFFSRNQAVRESVSFTESRFIETASSLLRSSGWRVPKGEAYMEVRRYKCTQNSEAIMRKRRLMSFSAATGFTTAVLAAIVLCESPAFAQDQAVAARTAAGCGPSQTQFDVKLDDTLHVLAQPEESKAIVYVFEDDLTGPTMRIGIDGSWVGATTGKSFIYFSLTPGEHSVCTEWQSNVFKKTSERVGGAKSLTVEAGKVYFLRMTFEEVTQASGRIKLELTDNAEGQFLLSSSALSNSHPKK
jgi:hypothetical protein